MDATAPQTTTVVLNADSRRGADAARVVGPLLAGAGFEGVSVRTAGSGAELADLFAEAMAEGPDLLVAGGGDGTIACAAMHAAGTDVALGVLPLGTANDFARTLEVPRDLERAVAALRGSRVVDVDLGRVDGRAYLNVASVGLSVAVTERLTPRLKRRLGPMAYPVATLLAYRGHAPFRARLEFPDGDLETLEFDDLLQVAVGNGRHYGGGNTVSPTASLDDGTLDVYAVQRGRLSDHVSIARLLKDGTFVEHERVRHLTTRRLRVVTEPALAVNLDGEIAARTPSTFEVQRNALHVAVPAWSTAARLDGPRANGSTAG